MLTETKHPVHRPTMSLETYSWKMLKVWHMNIISSLFVVIENMLVWGGGQACALKLIKNPISS